MSHPRWADDEQERSAAAAELAKLAHQQRTPRVRRKMASQAAKSFWDGLTPTERRTEMRRRRKLGIIRKKRRALGLPEEV